MAINRAEQNWPTGTTTVVVEPNCPKCGKPMLDGEVVQMTWSGEPVEHIGCPE